MTSVLANPGLCSTALMSVVLPLPRKPVTSVTAMRGSGVGDTVVLTFTKRWLRFQSCRLSIKAQPFSSALGTQSRQRVFR